MRASLVLLLAGILVTSTMAAPPLGRRESGDTGRFDCNQEFECPTGNETCFLEKCIDTTASFSADTAVPDFVSEKCCGFDTKKGIVVYDINYVDSRHNADPTKWWVPKGEAHNMYIILRLAQGDPMVTRDPSLNSVIAAMNCVTPGDGTCPSWVVFPEQQNKKYDSAGGLTVGDKKIIKDWTAAGGVLLHAYTAHRASNRKSIDNTWLEAVFGFSDIRGTLDKGAWQATDASFVDSTCLLASNGAPATLEYQNDARSNPSADIHANSGLVYYEGDSEGGKMAAVWGIPYGNGFVIGLAYDYYVNPYLTPKWAKILLKTLAEGFCQRTTTPPPGGAELDE